MNFPLAFLNPWALAGLIALPVLWIILRFLPPLPKKIFLPTTRFLLNVKNHQTTPDTAPWWLILLRFLLLAALILAFAGPVWNPQKAMTSSGPLRLVFDNGWASPQVWTMEMDRAEQVLQYAAKANRPVQLIPTASASQDNFIRADQALEQLRALEPMPYPGTIDKLKIETPADTIWISSGLEDQGFNKVAEKFAELGELTIYLPDMRFRPGLVHGASGDVPKSVLKIETPAGGGDRTLTAQAFDTKNKLINQINKTISGQSGGDDIIDEAGLFTDKKIYQWKVPAFSGAGGIYLNDISGGGASIGIVRSGKSKSQTDFSDASFYLTRAAEPFAKIQTGSIEELIANGNGVIVLPDIATFSPDTLDALEKWLKNGGVLLRFGGKSMSEADNVLIPVPLKTGLRSLSGDMSWTTSLKVTSFPKTSPFAGEKIPDIEVERQLLAEPSADLENHVWAALSDGTPFITAKPEGRGLIVLVHTTATPDWSDFVLSGFYVTFLKQVLELSALPDKSAEASAQLRPLLVFNGWGQLVQATPDVKSMTKAELNSIEPSKDHPPGLYGDNIRKYPFNLGDHITSLNVIDALPAGAKSESLTVQSKETRLSSVFFALSAFLFLIDWLLLVISSRTKWLSCLVLLLLFSSPAKADDIERAASIHLACVKTSQDDLCRTALNKLSNVIKNRTSTEIGTPVIVDLGKDDLSFYPLLYWPVDSAQDFSAKARGNLSKYLNKGGMVLIDTQDGAYETTQIVASPAVRHLRDMLTGIDIPPLKPAPKDHVLFKSFYLLNLYPEYDLTGKLWVEDDSIAPEEGLSSVIITGEDWLHRWGYPTNASDEEMAARFGVNLMMYALTGNYKADQVHMNAILKRMGE